MHAKSRVSPKSGCLVGISRACGFVLQSRYSTCGSLAAANQLLHIENQSNSSKLKDLEFERNAPKVLTTNVALLAPTPLFPKPSRIA